MIQDAIPSLQVQLEPGKKGEFSVLLDGDVIAQKGLSFPVFGDIVETIRARIE